VLVDRFAGVGEPRVEPAQRSRALYLLTSYVLSRVELPRACPALGRWSCCPRATSSSAATAGATLGSRAVEGGDATAPAPRARRPRSPPAPATPATPPESCHSWASQAHETDKPALCRGPGGGSRPPARCWRRSVVPEDARPGSGRAGPAGPRGGRPVGGVDLENELRRVGHR
jgi:hypothetical protein